MKNQPLPTPTNKTQPTPVWSFEVIDDDPAAGTSSWTDLGEALGPLLTAGRNTIEGIYASVAQILLERKEELEDWRTERRANQLQAVRVARGASGQRKTHLPKTHLEVVAKRKNRIAPGVKSRG